MTLDPDEEYEKLKKKGHFKEHTMSEQTKMVIENLATKTAMQFDHLQKTMDHHLEDIKKTLASIEIQTTKTNGRVNVLDTYHTKIKDPLDDLLQEKKERDKFARTLIWKIVAITSLATLLGTNADKITKLL